MLNAQFKMISTLLKGIESVAPKLICFLPLDAFEEPTSKRKVCYF